ncbi:VOC family protein [Actinoplanes sp. NPDC048791]|uniref:VOC family protein n=1 Tax=Actinoplanes sp. NPDC048791 TaxID=3154623 RepID=UPI0033E51C25
MALGSVVHFELPADDLDRAGTFYAEAFGWKFTGQGVPGTATVTTAPSNDYGRPTEPGTINGGATVRGGAVSTPVVTVEVADIDQALARVEELGGKRVQDRTPVGTYGFVGYFTDPEGNTVGLWQNAQS